jgi:hypothetical protein
MVRRQAARRQSITVGGEAYTLLTFTSAGTLTVTKAGLFDVLRFGGGGGGQRRQPHGHVVGWLVVLADKF